MSGRLQDYAAAQAAARPDAVAVVCDDERLTYGELEARSTALAHRLVAAGCGAGDRVCLLTGKTPAAIVAMHAVLKAGGVYVPLDVESPVGRLAKIVAAADPAVVLVADACTALVAALPLEHGVAVEPIDAGPVRPSRVARGLPGDERTSDDVAHILFTSGSTGDPKGVTIAHRNVVAFVRWAVAHFGTSADDRISGHPPLHFDLSTFDIFATFAAGAELHLVPPTAALNPRGMADWIRRSELTQWFSVPSAMAYLTRFGAVGDLPSLRRVLWCGEVLPTPVLIDWMRNVPQASFTNLYGPTEATIASSYHAVDEVPDDPATPIPIGRPCAGEQLRVLDADLRPLPPGEAGELWIGGAGLSPGYWRDAERTAEAFRQVDGDRLYRTGDLARVDDGGVAHFLGRADTQIKHRGYRIELGEVENALGAVAGLSEYAVVAIPTDGFEGTSICCAYAAPREAVTPAMVRSDLRDRLPAYMLPGRWERLDVLPKNVNGKIDRRRLQDLFAGNGAP